VAVQVLIGDRFGRVIDEVSPNVREVAWRLNKIGRATLVFSKRAAKATARNLQHGNRVLIRFSGDVGLPDWGGVIDPPRMWSGSEIEVSCYGIEYLLQFRRTDKTRAFDSVPVGRIIYQLLRETEAEQGLGLTFGAIWTGGRAHSPRYHFKALWTIIEELIEAERCDVRFAPQLARGRITFQAEVYDRLGEDKSGRWALKEGRNVTEATFTEQGPILNDFAAAGGGTTWGEERPTQIAYEQDSDQLYGLRQAGQVYSGVSQDTILAIYAESEVRENAYPHTRLDLTVANRTPATYTRYGLGDVVRCILPTYGFDGYDQAVRVLARETDGLAGSCKLIVEEERSPNVVPKGPGGESIEE